MENIKIGLQLPIINGQPLTFKAPCNCTLVEGIKVEYPNGEDTAFQVFSFADAHGNDLVGIGNLFAEGAMVKVILDTESSKAYIQNADTNAYIEGRLANLGIESTEYPGCFYRVVDGEIEWINPPMEDQRHYRTTKRHDGKVVYVTRHRCSLAFNRWSIGIGPAFNGEIISFQGNAIYSGKKSVDPFPVISTEGNIMAIAYMEDQDIKIKLFDNGCSAYEGIFTIEYTK